MSEKFSSIHNIVGKHAEVHKESYMQGFKRLFKEQESLDWLKFEKDKTNEELETISLANHHSNGLLVRQKLTEFDIPPDNFHIIRRDQWNNFLEKYAQYSAENSIDAFFSAHYQAIAMSEPYFQLNFAALGYHEMIHFKSCVILMLNLEQSIMPHIHRIGLAVSDLRKGQIYFGNLNEGITEELTKRFVNDIKNNYLFKNEVAEEEKIRKKYPLAKDSNGHRLFGKDTYAARIEDLGDGRGNIITTKFTRPQERFILNALIDKLWQKNAQQFESREQIFDVFVGGMLSGNIGPIRSLIQKSFGKGVFKKIGELDKDIDRQEKFVSSL